MLILSPPLPATFSFAVLLSAIFILLISGGMFHRLTRQWTTDRSMEAIADWARDRGFKLRLSPEAALPASLVGLGSADPQVQMTLTRGPIVLVRLSTATKPTLPRSAWNLVIRQTNQAHNPAGLRPGTGHRIISGFVFLTEFPSLLPQDRFVVFATESKNARKLAAGSARGLLPADIGLLIHGPYVTQDFSTRPFDEIEFERMLTIMEQIVVHLPA